MFVVMKCESYISRIKSSNYMKTDELDFYNQKYLNIIKDKILELASETSAVIFLFGSRASGTYSQGSDIDIGFENICKDGFRRISMRFNLFWEESIVPNKVDLVNFQDVSFDFIIEAKKDIVIWKAG